MNIPPGALRISSQAGFHYRILGPVLSVSATNNIVTITWPDSPGFVLEQNSNPAQTDAWTAAALVSVTNGTGTLVVQNPTQRLFYRLRGQ
jgi:hypothetical protein